MCAVRFTSHREDMKSQSSLSLRLFCVFLTCKDLYWMSRLMVLMQSLSSQGRRNWNPPSNRISQYDYCRTETVAHETWLSSERRNVSFCLKWHWRTDLHHNVHVPPVQSVLPRPQIPITVPATQKPFLKLTVSSSPCAKSQVNWIETLPVVALYPCRKQSMHILDGMIRAGHMLIDHSAPLKMVFSSSMN